jgi:hypothetical protein
LEEKYAPFSSNSLASSGGIGALTLETYQSVSDLTSPTSHSPLLESSLKISKSDSIVVLHHKATDITNFRSKENRLIGGSIDGGAHASCGDEDRDFDLAQGGLGERLGLGADTDGEGVGTEAEKVVTDEELCGTDLMGMLWSDRNTSSPRPRLSDIQNLVKMCRLKRSEAPVVAHKLQNRRMHANLVRIPEIVVRQIVVREL